MPFEVKINDLTNLINFKLPLIGGEFNELTLTEVHNCVKEVVVNEANVLHELADLWFQALSPHQPHSGKSTLILWNA